MELFDILLILAAVPPAILALVKIGGWARAKRGDISNTDPTWQDFVDDVQSLDGATDVTPNREDYRISLRYDRSRRQFHEQTNHNYEILNDKGPPMLMVEPLE